MTNRVSSEEMYAIKYLDSGGDPEKFSNRHKKIHVAIKNEAKRRFMVDIRHKINKSKRFKQTPLNPKPMTMYSNDDNTYIV